MESALANPAFLLLQSATAEALDRLLRNDPDDDDVHAARKALKRSRAALRLLRPLLGVARYRVRNAELRDAGRQLSPLRDAKTMLAVLDAAAAGHAADGHAEAIAGLRQALAHRLAAAREELAQAGARRDCVALIEATRAHVGPELPAAGPAELREALGAIYRKARSAFRRAGADATTAALHEWRKQTKYLRAAQAVFADARRRAMKKHDRRARRIGDWLGDEHDLAVLGELLAGRSRSGGATARMLVAEFDERRARLRDKALAKGAKLFRRKPRRYLAALLGES